jgi:hypothetical protein
VALGLRPWFSERLLGHLDVCFCFRVLKMITFTTKTNIFSKCDYEKSKCGFCANATVKTLWCWYCWWIHINFDDLKGSSGPLKWAGCSKIWQLNQKMHLHNQQNAQSHVFSRFGWDWGVITVPIVSDQDSILTKMLHYRRNLSANTYTRSVFFLVFGAFTDR